MPRIERDRLFQVVASIPHILIMPKLRSLAVNIDCYAAFTLEDMFPASRDYSLLHQVEFKLSAERWCELCASTFSTFSQMKSLSLSLSRQFSVELPGALELAKLREFHLKECSTSSGHLWQAIFAQEVVNLRSITLPQVSPTRPNPWKEEVEGDRVWMDFFKWKSKNKIYVQFDSVRY